MEEIQLEIPTPNVANRVKVKLLEREEDLVIRTYRRKCQDDFKMFYQGITIASVNGPRMFCNVMAEFQERCFSDMAKSLEQLRNGEMPEKRRFWIERTKKASKDADLAVIVIWLLAFPVRPFYIQVGAGNKEQANIVKERIDHLLHWNPWLNDYIEVVQYQVRSKKKSASGNPIARMDIMSADASGSHGGTPDLLLVNELTHIHKWEFAETLMDNADGVARGMVIIATNAGFRGSKAETWQKNALASDVWTTHLLSRPAPWHTAETLADARRRNTQSRYNRLWKGIWVSGRGDALGEDAIEAAFTSKGPIMAPEPGWDYAMGMDLAVKKDHAGLFVTGVNALKQKVKCACWARYKPDPKTGEINLMQVEEDALTLATIFRARLIYDPHQAALMAQRLRRKIPVAEMSFSSPNNLIQMADSFIQLMEEGRLELYDDADESLHNDIGKFQIVEKNYGHRLEAVADEHGHADVGTAMIITLPWAMDALKGLAGLNPDDVIHDADIEDLSEEEVKTLPQELREIFETEDEIKEEKLKKRVPKDDPLDGFYT